MYLFILLLASAVLMWALHRKAQEDDNGSMWD